MEVSHLVLVVDDEPAILSIACQYLRASGFTTLAVDSAQGALELIEQQVPDLLVIDVRLPDLPGPELALRVHLRYPRLPVLFISGWPEARATIAELDPLLWMLVEKPFSGESLAHAARTLLGKPPAPADGSALQA